MIDRFISLGDLIEKIYRRDFAGLTSTQKVKIRGPVMCPDDWDVLIALRDSLEPFKKVTTVLSGRYPTQSMSYFALEVLKASVKKSSYPSRYHRLANESLWLQYQYYLMKFLPNEQKDYMKVSKTISIF